MRTFLASALLVVITAVSGQLPISPNPIEGSVGDNVDITCSYSEPDSITLETFNVPEGDFDTVPNSELVGGAPTINAGDSTVFTLGPLQWSDNGRIVRCRLATIVSANAIINVLFPPMFTLYGASPRTVTEGDEVVITVQLDGNPTPTQITFTRPQSANMEVMPVVQDGVVTITFPSVNRGDSGMYSLSASTSAGNGRVDFELNVQYPPMFVAELAEGFTCLDSTLTPILCVAMEGTNGRLICDSDGNPTPELTVNCTEVSGTVSSTNGFAINNTDAASHTGTYTCTATNTVGTATRSFRFYVGTHPNNAENFTAVVGTDEVTISWDYNDGDNGVSVMSFQLELTKIDGQEQTIIRNFSIGGDQRQYNISLADLETNTAYQVTVSARNHLGDSAMATAVNFIIASNTPMPTTKGASANITQMPRTTDGASAVSASFFLSALFIILASLIC